ncbi:MAG: hypothetical protein JO261_01145 [Alphaproteobacteria bacterium]|nr:hypothetical protein [Alphaproteobacteria bacterium]MBV9692282.1 hypothetical protein [Alphaproteobacteria bacterium]
MRRLMLAAAFAALAGTATGAEVPTEVMIVGGFHMSNPGHDLHNVQVDDVLAPKRQQEIAAVVDGLARFKPTMVAVEWDAPYAAEKYRAYVAGTLAPSHNEVVQLGFRLAKQMGLATVHGIDADGDFPYDAIDAYAKAHGESAILQQANDAVVARVAKITDMLAHGTVGETLRFMNDPANIASDHDFYREMLRIGGGKDQPGADLLAAWYKRNFLICANLVQAAKPGDRVVVFYGSGHSFLLRQCVSEMPGYRLVEAGEYLRR